MNSHLVVFAEVCPHAGTVSTPHQHMVSKEIDPRYGTGKLSCGRVIVIPEISDYVVELKQLVALMLLLKARVEGNFWHGAVGGGTDGASAVWPRGSW